VAVNPANGHALTAYLLRNPVHNFAGSRGSPLHYMAAVQRGLRRRLEADPRYVGLVAKNPYHPAWRVEWQAPAPYYLDELADHLFPQDTRPEHETRESFGVGRNCHVFDEVRVVAYREVLQFKSAGTPFHLWQQRCTDLCLVSNQQFAVPLAHAEIRAIAKSIAKWTWSRFSEARFSELQARRGSRMRRFTKARMAIVEALRHGSA
jgi:hypothetical protein